MQVLEVGNPLELHLYTEKQKRKGLAHRFWSAQPPSWMPAGCVCARRPLPPPPQTVRGDRQRFGKKRYVIKKPDDPVESIARVEMKAKQ